jgi:molybdopterin molybdotransferase
MIEYEQAIRAILERAHPVGKKRVKLEESRGCVLARDISAKNDNPPFSQSAMDGFAVRAEDVEDVTSRCPISLPLIATVRAGDVPRTRLKPGRAVKILTGAKLPQGADAVVMKEFCEESDGFVRIEKTVRPGENVRNKGEEFRKGDLALTAGVRITPPVVGLLATLGHASVTVYKLPRLSLIVTGNELVAPGERLGAGKIRDSNSYALEAAFQELGVENCMVHRVKDDPAHLKKQIGNALRRSDVVVTVGGVSVGDYDFVKDVLQELRVETVFWRVAIKPGKPNYFGVFTTERGKRKTGSRTPSPPNRLVFGLPGNPVSALLSYHQLVKPALLRMIGQRDVAPLVLTGQLAVECKKKKGRMEWVRANLTSDEDTLCVCPTEGQDSHMLGGLARADCIFCFPKSESEIAKNHPVAVELLDWRK